MRTIRLTVVGLLGLVLTSPFHGSAQAVGYNLPHDKTKIEACIKAAIEQHPGSAEKVDMRAEGREFHVKIHIQDRYGKEWIVFCDGTTGRSTRTIDVDGTR